MPTAKAKVEVPEGSTATGRASFRGVLAFSLVNMNVGLFKATNDDPSFKQVHKEDGGAIFYRRYCEICQAEVPYEDIGRGQQIGGVLYTFTDEEIADLPVAGSTRAIRITQFVSQGEIDLIGFGPSYYIEPDEAGVRAYTLLRQRMKAKRKVAIARFAFKEGAKDLLAVIRPQGNLLILQRMTWPEDIRIPTFPFLLEESPSISGGERDFADVLLDTMTSPWVPAENRSEYGSALDALRARKVAGGPPDKPPPTTPAQATAREDIGAVLAEAIKLEKAKRGESEDAA